MTMPEVELRISYLFVLKNSDFHLLPVELVEGDHIRRCGDSSKKVSVFQVPPRQVSQVPEDISDEDLLKAVQIDMDRLINDFPIFDVTNKTHEWDSSFVLWPIIRLGSSQDERTISEVRFSVFWDYLVVQRSNDQQFDLIVSCIATTLARYRTLSLAIRALEEQIEELVDRLTSDDYLEVRPDSEVQTERWSLMSEFVSVDPVASLKWGFEFRLLSETIEAWNLNGLEKKAQESERIVAQLTAELAMRRERHFSMLLSEKSSEQTRATRRLGFVVGLLALLQLPQTFISIAGTFSEKDNPPEWMAIASLTVSALLGVWMFVQHRKSND